MLTYQDGELFCESTELSQIARRFGTPTYVYSRAELVSRADAFLGAARRIQQNCLVCYAVKANGNPELLDILSAMGFGADIVSGGELFLALKSGFDPQRIVFSGVGKTYQEIAEAISAGILALHLESRDEQEVISRVASSLGKIATVAVRVNPDIRVDTHAHVATGQKHHKFGVPAELASEMLRSAKHDPWLRPVGLSTHLGSQIASAEPFRQVAETLVQLADGLSVDGLQLDYLDIGGGLAIDYDSAGIVDSDAMAIQERAPSIDEWLSVVSSPLRQRGYQLLIEPGRSVVGSAGILLTRILYTKNQGGRRNVVVDAGMNDLIRPALYGAKHPIVPILKDKLAGRNLPTHVDIVGPVCESSDILAHDHLLPDVKPGELLAILHTGAYGFSMSSNYNGRLRPAEVLVDRSEVRCIRPREEYNVLLGHYRPT